MEHYNKFYEIDNNRYYTINADDELFIASESLIKLGKQKKFGKQKELITGFKLLKVSAPIAKLFSYLGELQPSKKQRYDSDDLIIYEHIDNKRLKKEIEDSYMQVYNEEIEHITKVKEQLLEKGNENDAKICENTLKKLKDLDLMAGVDLTSPEHTGCMIIKTMLREGLEHLYTERVNAFTKNVYLYEQDEFGTLTIYKIITIKNVVKSVDTFIYDKKLIDSLLKTLYEKGE